jgi:thiamine biosynthesis lipoprotein
MRVSAEMYDILTRAVKLAEQTQGAFDPTCGHLSQLWRRAKRHGKLPPADRLAKAVEATDWRRITLHAEMSGVTLVPGTLLDLGGIAKGYAADECLRVLKKHGPDPTGEPLRLDFRGFVSVHRDRGPAVFAHHLP